MWCQWIVALTQSIKTFVTCRFRTCDLWVTWLDNFAISLSPFRWPPYFFRVSPSPLTLSRSHVSRKRIILHCLLPCLSLSRFILLLFCINSDLLPYFRSLHGRSQPPSLPTSFRLFLEFHYLSLSYLLQYISRSTMSCSPQSDNQLRQT